MSEDNSELLRLLLTLQESVKLDHKVAFSLQSESEKAEFAKDVSALANTEGGHIVYGVKDRTLEKIGINPEAFDRDRMQQVVSSRIDPPVEFSACIVRHEGLDFGILIIPESSLKPHQIVKTGQIFIRREATTDKAKTEEIEKMLRDREPLDSIDLEPEDSIVKTAISLGRKYTIWRYGRLDVSLEKERVALAVLGFMLFVPLFYIVYYINAVKAVPDTTWLVFSLISTLFGILLLSMLAFIERAKCQKCGKVFGVRRVDSMRIGEKEVYRTDTEIELDVLFRNTYQCEFCGDKKVKKQSRKRVVNIQN